MTLLRDVGWWVRWFVVFLPRLAWRRVTRCRRGHHWYDGEVCLRCGSPWFFYDREAL